MPRYRRGDQLETRVADRLEVGDAAYTVDLIAKKATGVEGYQVTLSYIQVDGPDTAFVRLEPAATREEVTGRAEELGEDPDRLRTLLEARRA